MQARARSSLFWLGLAALAGCGGPSPCDRVEAGEHVTSDPTNGPYPYNKVICVDVMVEGNGCEPSKAGSILSSEVCSAEDFEYDRTCAFEDGDHCCYVFERLDYECDE